MARQLRSPKSPLSAAVQRAFAANLRELSAAEIEDVVADIETGIDDMPAPDEDVDEWFTDADKVIPAEVRKRLDDLIAQRNRAGSEVSRILAALNHQASAVLETVQAREDAAEAHRPRCIACARPIGGELDDAIALGNQQRRKLAALGETPDLFSSARDIPGGGSVSKRVARKVRR